MHCTICTFCTFTLNSANSAESAKQFFSFLLIAVGSHPKRKPKHPRGTSWILAKELSGSKHLWLPLELTKRPKIEMHNPVILFNITQGEVNGLSERFHQQAYYYSLADENWKDPSLQLPVEAITRACTFCDKAVEWGKVHNERFRHNHDRFVEQILEPGRTGYSRWLLRGLLYGSLLKVYRADLEAQRKNRRILSNFFQKFASFKKKLYFCRQIDSNKLTVAPDTNKG